MPNRLRRTRRGTVATASRSNVMKLSDQDRQRLGRRAGFDGAATNRYTKNHFADASSADITSIIMGDRAELVKRCRYEYRNNAYAMAMVKLWANEIIGTGPTLQMETDNNRFNTRIEELWKEWAKHCDASEKQNLAGLLRTGMAAIPQFGEEFTTFKNARPGSRSAAQHDIMLRLLEVNPQRISSPIYEPNGNISDGVEIDEDTGAPVNYLMYKNHPASTRPLVSMQYDTVPADDILHLFLTDEPGQYRGFPSMAPVVTLMGDLRRYTKAVVAAAEQAANISGVIYSTMTNQTDAVAKAMDEIEIARNTLLTLPMGYEAQAFKPAQPTNTYGDFKQEIIGEIGRAFMMPFIMASGNAQGYNYSSGRLDLQEWWKAIGIIQDYVAERKLDYIFARFMQEAILLNQTMPGYLPGFTKRIQDYGLWNIPHKWNWPGHEHVDPKKEADAQKVRLENNTTTLAHEYAKQGKDWEREVEQKSREQERLQELGLLPDTSQPSAPEAKNNSPSTPARSDDEDGLYEIAGQLYEMRNGTLEPFEVTDAS